MKMEGLAVLLILALAAYLRLAYNADNPGWYTDEGTHLAIAQNLAQGRVQYLAVKDSTLRTLTGVLGVATVGRLSILARQT